MSFSSNVKSELSHHFGEARHCNIAEIAAIINMCGHISVSGENFCVKIQTENVVVARKCFTLLKKTFNIECEILLRRNTQLKKNRVYVLVLGNKNSEAKKVLSSAGLLHTNGDTIEIVNRIYPLVVSSTCCKRAYVRGAFLAAGSVSDPEKTYHMEFVSVSLSYSEDLKNLINTFGMDAKIVKRKEHYIVYLKEGEQIVDLLNIMEAHIALMEMENVRILKDMRNNVNRKVNCETANLNKTITASVKQVEDITFIMDKFGLSYLPKPLEEMAIARMDFPEASLKELGQMMEPPVGKSGVNHRLRKISDMAESLREDMVIDNG
ncbi:MAG TPA: DNA-binding protein WhiA [Lachnospiraceae bacterium]|nr:DNA-binding protein WhiA [Lachnospiraceae bacterium]